MINQECWSTEESYLLKYYRVAIENDGNVDFSEWTTYYEGVVEENLDRSVNSIIYNGYNKITTTSNLRTVEFNISKGSTYEIKIESTMIVNRPNLYIDFYTGSQYIRGDDTNTYYLKNIHKYGYNGSSNINTIITNSYNEFVSMWDYDGTETWIGGMMYIDAKLSWMGQQPCIYGFIAISDSTQTKCLSYDFYMVGDKDTFVNMNKVRLDFFYGSFGTGSIIEFNKLKSL